MEHLWKPIREATLVLRGMMPVNAGYLMASVRRFAAEDGDGGFGESEDSLGVGFD